MSRSWKGLDDPGLSMLGPEGLEPFAVASLPNARIAWLNRRWFLENGVAVNDPATRRTLEQDLLERFAVIAAGPPRTTSGKVLHADRYGGSLGSRHGGSGRCGTLGGIIAKGVGPTPLVSRSAALSYAHGGLTLAEAMREAVLSEIAAAELPHGAVPTLAIIDTGVQRPIGPEGQDRRAAILLRPCFVRPAHLERSVYFGTGGAPRSEQFRDATRVRDAIAMAGRTDRLPLEDPHAVRTMFRRFAEQLGAARAWRLWQGRFLTSNNAVDGAMVDFGSFRSVPNWCAATGLPGERFGDDGVHLRVAVQSICFYLKKYAAGRFAALNEHQIAADLDQVVNRTFLRTCLEAVRVDHRAPGGKAARVEAALWRFYKAQQRVEMMAESQRARRHGFLFLDDPAAGSDRPGAPEATARCALERLLSEHVAADPTGNAGYAVRRWRMSRPRLQWDRATSASEVAELAVAHGPGPDGDKVRRFIDDEIGANRRHWPGLDPALGIVGQVSTLDGDALFCERGPARDRRIVLAGPVLDGERLCLFGVEVPLGDLPGAVSTGSGCRASIELGLPDASGGEEPVRLTLAGVTIDVPPPQVRYDDGDMGMVAG